RTDRRRGGGRQRDPGARAGDGWDGAAVTPNRPAQRSPAPQRRCKQNIAACRGVSLRPEQRFGRYQNESKVQTIERTIQVEQTELLMAVFGAFDENIKLIERELGVSVVSRGSELKLSGEDAEVDVAARTIGALTAMAGRGEAISTQTVQYVIGLARDGREAEVHTMSRDVLCITAKGKPVKAKTLGQKRYMEAIQKNTIVMGVGPAGTGKTYLAVAAAVAAFRDKRVSRIILTRPAVEAGEKLGFLPGDLQSKVDPYLRPLYDGLFDMLGAENFAKYQERGSIEVAPLA